MVSQLRTVFRIFLVVTRSFIGLGIFVTVKKVCNWSRQKEKFVFSLAKNYLKTNTFVNAR